MSGNLRATRSRWARRLRAAAVVAGLALALLALAVWLYGWWAPPTYTPAASVPVRGQALDGSAHDARVTLLGDNAYAVHIEASQGALLFFGARHSKDPAHPQLDELRRLWQKFRPTVALLEGRQSFFVGSETQGIRIFGEGAAVYSLAQRAGIPLFTLEPPLEVEIAALDACGDRMQVAMFRTLSGYISARRGGSVSEFKVGRLLHRRAAPLTHNLPTIAAFDAYVATQLTDLPPEGWRGLPEQAMWPGQTDTLLHRMATASNRVRDEHFVRTLLDLTKRGQRVLAIAGRSHTVILEPLLWESLQPASRGELSSPRPWESGAD